MLVSLFKWSVFPSNRIGVFMAVVMVLLSCFYVFSSQILSESRFSLRTIAMFTFARTKALHRYSLATEMASRNTSRYYRHASGDRNSSYPLISGDTFRCMADHVYDETKMDNLNAVQYGEIVFVKGDILGKFFDNLFKSIKNPFVLVTHNSDQPVTEAYRKYLNDTRLLHWYASNPYIEDHRKLHPIPIGLGNRRWGGGNLAKIFAAMNQHRKPWRQRTTLLYVNFAVGTNAKERGAAVSQAKKFQNVQIITSRISLETYLEQIGNAKFVLSPPGNGLDCHRTWEAIVMGATPVVLSSTLDPLFDRASAVIIDYWSNLTETRLLSYDAGSRTDSIPDVLYARYWYERLLKHRSRDTTT